MNKKMTGTFSLVLPVEMKYLHLVSHIGFWIAKTIVKTDQEEDGSHFSHGFELAISEAFTNSVKHGLAGGEESKIIIDFNAGEDDLTVIIKDPNPQFNPETQPSSSDNDRYKSSGYGLSIIHEIMDKVHYQRENGWNMLTMYKRTRVKG